MVASFFKASAGAAEQKLNTYVYNKEGNLCQVTNHMSGKTYYLDYDFLDRLMRVRDEKGSYYEYTYDSNNHMRKLFQQGSQGGAAHVTTTYSYDKDGREKETRVSGKFSRVTDYDSLGRVQGLYMNVNNAALATTFEYGNSPGSSLSAQPSSIGVNGERYFYEHNANGNITSVEFLPALNSTKKPWKETYQYDERNQLIRENSQQQNKTFVYAYDLGGNLPSVKEYPYTEGTITAAPLKTETGTYASGWKDQLVNWNGTAMTYDAIGNMLARGNTTYSWTLGRKLAAVDNGKKIQYFYDHTGSRTKKIVDGVATEYRMAGDLLMSETTNGQTLWFTYDSNANLFSMVTGGKHYFYQRNLQNDIIALVDESGDTVVNYTYDSWGRILSITGSRKDTIGQLNPFRYRGYYYDKETGMYYLKNRYYDPEIRRFICADKYVIGANSILSNMYVYCGNTPVTCCDPDGKFFKKLFGVVRNAWNSVKKSVNKIFNVQIGASNTNRYKVGISGIGSVAYSHSVGKTKDTNSSPRITFYSSSGVVTTHELFNRSGYSQRESDTGVNIKIGFVQLSISSEVFTEELLGVSSSVALGNYSLNSNYHYNYKDQSIGISLGVSKTENDETEISNEIALDVGISAIIGMMIGLKTGSSGVVGRIAKNIH